MLNKVVTCMLAAIAVATALIAAIGSKGTADTLMCISVLSVPLFGLLMGAAAEGTFDEIGSTRTNAKVGLGLVGGWVALMALIHVCSMKTPSAFFDDELLTPRLRTGVAAVFASLPPPAAWDHRALVGTAWAAVGFVAFLPMFRLASRSWFLSVISAAVFSVGVGQISRDSVFRHDASDCDTLRAAAVRYSTLTTEDLNTFHGKECDLPKGFAMNRDLQRDTAPGH